MALPQVGIALAFRRKGLDGRVFVLLGDGECDEGAVWEAAMSAAQFRLDTLVFIVDNNHLKYDGPVDPMMDSDHLGRMFGAFGFDVERVDGHAVPELYAALARAAASTAGKPTAIIAETVKGKGVSFMENRKEWHHGRMSAEQYARAIEEVGE
jgi:transketolase